MKRVKKNHIIITALAIMIAAAGYINYAGDLDNIIKVKDKEKAAAVVADNVSTDSNDHLPRPPKVLGLQAGHQGESIDCHHQVRLYGFAHEQVSPCDTDYRGDPAS